MLHVPLLIEICCSWRSDQACSYLAFIDQAAIQIRMIVPDFHRAVAFGKGLVLGIAVSVSGLQDLYPVIHFQDDITGLADRIYSRLIGPGREPISPV